MSDPFGNRPFPRGVLIATAALIGFVLVTVAVVRFVGGDPAVDSGVTPVEARMLRFEDRRDGAVVVREADSDQVVAVLDPGTNGFIRGVLRGLARDRMLNSVGSEPPFRLALWPNGRLSLEDPSTGRAIDLNAFGATNLAAFGRLLESHTPSLAQDEAAAFNTQENPQGPIAQKGNVE